MKTRQSSLFSTVDISAARDLVAWRSDLDRIKVKDARLRVVTFLPAKVMMADRPQIWHWRQDEDIKNFGDYLADFLTEELFEPISWHEGTVHVIGSVIADFLVPDADVDDQGRPLPKVVFWGCGARDENGLSEDRMARSTILAVRGPLTASALKLGGSKPQGDIAFFLPALYTPKRSRITSGKAVCIPHFWDPRPDETFLGTGCSVVLRTNILGGNAEIRRLIDAIASAEFVLTASLHGAVAAAAYGVPFAFWDNGHVDLPFKWKDLAAYLSIPPTFYTSLEEARKGYEEDIRPALVLPSLGAFLASAPFPIRQDAFAKILRQAVSRGGETPDLTEIDELIEELERHAPDLRAGASGLMSRLGQLTASAAAANAALQDLELENARLIQLRDDVGGALEAQQNLVREQEQAIEILRRTNASREVEDRNQANEDAGSLLEEQFEAGKSELRDLSAQREHLLSQAAARHDELEIARRAGITLAGDVAALKSELEAAVDRRDSDSQAILNGLSDLLARASGISNAADESESIPKNVPSELEEAFRDLSRAISSLRETARSDAQLGRRLSDQVASLTMDADEAWKQTHATRETLQNANRRLAEVDLQRESAESRLLAVTQELEAAEDERRALRTLVAEQDRQLQGAFDRLAALSRQVEAGAREADLLTRTASDAERARDSAQKRYERIAGSRTWRLVRRSRQVREYFAPHRIKQRGRRIVRILTGKGRKPKAAPSIRTSVPSVVLPTSTKTLSVFVIDRGGASPSAVCVERLLAMAHAGVEVIVCGDVRRWRGKPVRAIQAATNAVVRELNAHMATTGNAVTLVVSGPEAVPDGNLDSFAAIFEAHPQAVAAAAVVIDDSGRIVAAGGRTAGDNVVEPDHVGTPHDDFRVASVERCQMLWPAAVALDADAFRHLGGLPELDSYETAIVAYGVKARSRGLDVVINPFVQIRGKAAGPLAIPAAVAREARDLGAPRRPSVLFTDAVTPTPDRDSGSIDIYWYMRIFSQLGYDVTFLPVQDLRHAGRYTDDLRLLGIRCPLRPDVEQPWMFLRDFGPMFDLVMTYRASAACHVIEPIREFAPQARVVFDTVDLHFLREERAALLEGSEAGLELAARTRVEELKIMAMSDATILLSSTEYDHVAEIAPEVRRYLISIVRPVSGRLGPVDDRRGSIFVGGFKHAPNSDAVFFLCRDVWPIVRAGDPTAELSIIGSDVTPEIQALHDPANGVTVVGYVENLDHYYRTARINLAPLRYGAGVKGKVAASLAVGLPTVATSIAVEGMELTNGKDVLWADDAEGFASAIVRLASDDDLWDTISRNSVDAARANLSIEAATSRLKALLTDLGLPAA